jgi:deltex-like protein
MNDLSEASGFEEDAGLPPADVSPAAIDLFKLKKCSHMMHRACLIMYSKNSKDGQVM